MPDNKTTTSTKAKAGNIKTAPDNAKKPSEVKGDAPASASGATGAAGGNPTSETDIVGANPPEATGIPGATVGKSPTAPDAVNEAARLGGSTVEELRDTNGPAADEEE